MMGQNGLLAQVDRVERMESELDAARQRVGHFLRLVRESAELSLRDVAPDVGLTAAGLSYIERGQAWKTATVRRIAEWYATHHAA